MIRLLADDGTPVLSGSVQSVGQYDAVEIIDYPLRQKIGDVIHADTASMVDAAWVHYRLRVNWWHRNISEYATVWAAGIALFLGLSSLLISVLTNIP